MSHTITVTRVFNDPEADSDDPEYTIGGEHDPRCEAYWPCLKQWHRHPKNENDEMDEWSTKRVPFHHAWIEGEWMVPMKHRCGLDISFEYDNPVFQMTEVGVYDVEVDWDGDWWSAKLTLRTPPTAGSTE